MRESQKKKSKRERNRLAPQRCRSGKKAAAETAAQARQPPESWDFAKAMADFSGLATDDPSETLEAAVLL
jgi:hypothetical protein